jgi:predicted ATP-dependent serine protease
MIESSAWAPTSGLLGRDAERQRLDAVLDHLRQGSAALMVRGEPGIGKSAFLHHARERAGDLGAGILAAVGSESEAELAFAGPV